MFLWTLELVFVQPSNEMVTYTFRNMTWDDIDKAIESAKSFIESRGQETLVVHESSYNLTLRVAIHVRNF